MFTPAILDLDKAISALAETVESKVETSHDPYMWVHDIPGILDNVHVFALTRSSEGDVQLGHSSHASHASHASHCSGGGYGFCDGDIGGVVTVLAPSIPSAPVAVAGQNSATVSWTAPLNDGGSPITGYTVTTEPGGVTVTTTGTSATVTGLSCGAYTFSVIAENSAGDSIPSPASGAVSVGIPTAPTNLEAAAGATNRQVVLTWSAPLAPSEYPITKYTVVSTALGLSQDFDPSSTSALLSNIPFGTFTYTVTATNACGTSPASSGASLKLAAAPIAPGKPSVSTGNGKITVHWSRPASLNGAKITGYLVRYGSHSKTVSGSARSLTISHLKPGKYAISVIALSDAGSSLQSSTVSVKVK